MAPPAAASPPGRRSAAALAQVAGGAVMISFAAVWVRLVDVGPTTAGMYRMLVGGLVLLPVALMRRERLWAGRRAAGYVAAAAVCFTLDLAFWHKSVLLVGPGLATILANFQVFLLAGFGIVVLRERPHGRFALAVPAALLGLFLLVGTNWRVLPDDYRAGVMFGLLTALSYGTYLLVLRASQARPSRLEPLPNLMAICWITAGMLALVAVAEGESLRIPSASTGGLLLVYGVTAQVLGWLLISRGIAHVEAGRAGLMLLLQPSLAFVWDVLFFHRPTSVTDLAGASIALGAIYLGTLRRAGGPAGEAGRETTGATGGTD
jgi:drug/metabolite transporter (DMT)-like permease